MVKLWSSWIFVAVCLLAITPAAAVDPANITIGVIHPGTDPAGWPVGDMIEKCMNVAFEMINADNTVLPNTKLILDQQSSSCSVGKGLLIMRTMMNTGRAFILGTGCSSVAMATSPGFAELKVPMLSYGNSHPDLSIKSKYPWYFRVSASDALIADASVGMMKGFGWTTGAATISDITWISVTSRFVATARKNKITVITQTLVVEPTKTKQALLDLKRSKAKIFFTTCYGTVFLPLLKESPGIGLLDGDYAWMAPVWMTDTVSDKVAQPSMAGFIAFDQFAEGTKCVGGASATCTETGTYGKFLTKFKAKYPSVTVDRWKAVGPHCTGVYDSAVVAANSLSTVFKKSKYPGSAGFGTELFNAMKKIGDLNIKGTTIKTLKFDANQEFQFAFDVYSILKGGATKTKVGTIQADGKLVWSAKDKVVFPAAKSSAKVTSTIPTDKWPVPESKKMAVNEGDLIGIIIGLALAWVLLTVPQMMMLNNIVASEDPALLTLANYLKGEVMTESCLDAMELSAAALIVVNFESTLTSHEIAQVVFVALAVLSILFLDIYSLLHIQKRNLEHVVTFRHQHSAGSLFIISIVMGIEVKLYLDSLALTDLICMIVLSIDLGYRAKGMFELIKGTLAPPTAADAELKKADTTQDATTAIANGNDNGNELPSPEVTIGNAPTESGSTGNFGGCCAARS